MGRQQRSLRGETARHLWPVELCAFLALALAPLPDSLPRVIPLLVAASISYLVRGTSFPRRGPGLYAAIGAGAGLAALAAALIAGTPLVEALTERSVEWSVYPIVRGSPGAAFAVAIVVAVTALAAELVLRGWVVERVLELGGPPMLAIFAGALGEALVTDANLGARIGAFIFGAGLGWIFVAAGRSLGATICTRLAFVVGALVLEALQLIG